MDGYTEQEAWDALRGYTAAVEEATKHDPGSAAEARAEATARRHLRWIASRLGLRVDDPFGMEQIRSIAGG